MCPEAACAPRGARLDGITSKRTKNRRENPPKIPRNPDFLLLFRGFSSGFRCVSSHGFFLVSCASGGGWGGATKGGFGVGGASVCLSGRLGGGWGGVCSAVCLAISRRRRVCCCWFLFINAPPPLSSSPLPTFFFLLLSFLSERPALIRINKDFFVFSLSLSSPLFLLSPPPSPPSIHPSLGKGTATRITPNHHFISVI